MLTIKLYMMEGATGRAAERRIFMDTPFALKETCKELPGARWNKNAKMWTVPATTSSAQAIARAVGEDERISMTMDEECVALFEQARRVIDAQELKTADDLPSLPTQTEAWLHQRRAFAFSKELDAAMLAMDMGTGKSLVAIGLLEEWGSQLVLIMCPKSVVGVWPKQFETHALEPKKWFVSAPYGKMTVLQKAQYISDHLIQAAKLERNFVVVVNYDAAWRAEMAKFLQSCHWDAIILDESHRVKSAGGKQSMFATSLRKMSTKRLALSGTPMPHSPMDIYAQYRFLDPGIFGTSKNRFKNRYAVQETKERKDGRSYDQIVDWQNMDEFNERFASIAFVVSKEEALPDLPKALPPIYRTFKLGPKGLSLYARMKEDFIGEVDEGTVVAANALSRTLRLRQIAAGHTKTDDGTVVQVDDGREDTLQDVLADIPEGEPVVVFASFHADLDAIERVAARLGLVYGELSGRRRDGLASDSTMSGSIDILGCQLKSGGVGVDFTRSCYAIYYTVGYELGDYDQSKSRLHRPGQTKPVRYIHLVAENVPIDQIVLDALQARKNVINAVMTAAKERML